MSDARMSDSQGVVSQGVVYIVDDDPALRDAICFLVGSVGYAARACESAAELLRRIEEDRPACLVLDVRLPGLSGLELQRELYARESSARIIFITGHGDIPKAVRAIRCGAVDFLEKPFDDQVLLDRIGEALDASAAELRRRASRLGLERRLAGLTERERDVLRLVIAGKTSKGVASALDISAKTVENHRHNIMTKAGVASVAQLIVWATEVAHG
jgi:FixJ family two-component response regulator